MGGRYIILLLSDDSKGYGCFSWDASANTNNVEYLLQNNIVAYILGRRVNVKQTFYYQTI